MYIHERENWFNFVWDNEKILPVLAAVRHLQGRLLGHMEKLGFDLIERATLESLILDVVDTSRIEGEFLNPELPDAQIKDGDGIGSKYENMAKSWGKIQDYSAIDNIDRDEPEENQEAYESQYTEDDIALLSEQEQSELVPFEPQQGE